MHKSHYSVQGDSNQDQNCLGLQRWCVSLANYDCSDVVYNEFLLQRTLVRRVRALSEALIRISRLLL